MKKGDLVTHGVWWSKRQCVQSIVRAVHKDGSATVEKRFVLDDAGERRGCYLGYRERLAIDDLQPCQQ